MSFRSRFKQALVASGWHLLGSGLVALLSAIVVFGCWYPKPYDVLSGGFFLWGMVVAIDVICGPMLTLVVFDRKKPRGELIRDLSLIVFIQLLAFGYGMFSVASARPLFLAFEGNRYRVVSIADIDISKLAEAPPEFREIQYGRPALLGVKLIDSEDPDFRSSVLQSVQGLPPAFRPGRWVRYKDQLNDLSRALKPISILKSKYPDKARNFDEILTKHGLDEKSTGYLPVEAFKASSLNWIAIVNRSSGEPLEFFAVDGW